MSSKPHVAKTRPATCFLTRAMHLAWIAVLASCVPSRSSVFGPVDRESRRRIGVEVAWSDGRANQAVAKLLDQPLTLDAAIRIALTRNAHLQAQFEGLGIAASEIAAATVLPPAELDFDHKFAVSGSGSESEVEVVQDVLA